MGTAPKYTDETLLALFNQRDAHAFGTVFRLLYKELYLYASRIFATLDTDPEDAIQDVFADIWKRPSVQFSSLEYIKTFCFIALKNAYKNTIKHLSHQQRFEMEMRIEADFANDMERIEQYRTLHDTLPLLPPDYATVIRMYLEGWKPEEIASCLSLALQTVYNKRREAILLLRQLIK